MTPMAVLERLYGSPEAISLAVGRHPKTAYKWRHPKASSREAGDVPNPVTMRRLLAHARANGIPLEHRHLIEGATEAEVAQLLASMPRGEAAA